jgi:hypothetical protein
VTPALRNGFQSQKPNKAKKERPMIGSLMMCLSVVVLLVGMLAGIAMGIAQNFVLAPAHAHLNLIGGVLLFLFGLYYLRLVPAGGTTTSPRCRAGCTWSVPSCFRPASPPCC